MLLAGFNLFMNLWLLLRYARFARRKIPALRYCLAIILVSLAFSLFNLAAMLLPQGTALEVLVALMSCSGLFINSLFALTVFSLAGWRHPLLVRVRPFLLLVPLLSLPLYATNSWHHLFVGQVEKHPGGLDFTLQYGPLALPMGLYSFLVIFAALLYIFLSNQKGVLKKGWIRGALVFATLLPFLFTLMETLFPLLAELNIALFSNWASVGIICHLFFGYLFTARQRALDIVDDTYVVFDHIGTCVDINWEGVRFFERHAGTRLPSAQDFAALLNMEDLPETSMQDVHLRDGDQDKYFQITGFRLNSGLNQDCGTGYIIHETTRYVKQVSRLNTIAVEDPLTGAKNRRYLAEAGRESFAAAARAGRSIAVLMLDIDHFKRVNDTHGHAVGDEVLVGLCRVIQASIRDEDFVVRYGGEEFLVLCENMEQAGAFLAAQRIRRGVALQPFPTADGPVRVTVSIGVHAGVPASGNDLEAFTAQADDRLYEAKNTGRDRVC